VVFLSVAARLPVRGGRAAALALVIAAVAAGARAEPARLPPPQQWARVESKAANIRFTIPSGWQSKTGVKQDRPFVEAVSPDASIYVVVYSFQDASMSNDDVLDQALDELGVDLDDDPEEETIHGLDALVGETTDTVNGREVGLFILAASYGDTRYVAYVMSDAARFDDNAKTMNRILDSFAPLAR
jgi:hypothetical protein